MADAGRVIAGSAAGIRLRAPGRARGRWPTGSSRRCSRSSSRTSRGAVLDLFAGSGAAGIEALSRGAAAATFVEQDRWCGRGHRGEPRADPSRRTAAAVVRADASPGWLGAAAPRRRPVRRRRRRSAVRRHARSSRADPRDPRVGRRMRLLGRAARVVAKHFWRDRRPSGRSASIERERRFGETALTFYRRGGRE